MESVTRPDATESKYDSRRDDQRDESVDMVKARSDVGSSSTPKPEQNSSDPRMPSGRRRFTTCFEAVLC